MRKIIHDDSDMYKIFIRKEKRTDGAVIEIYDYVVKKAGKWVKIVSDISDR